MGAFENGKIENNSKTARRFPILTLHISWPIGVLQIGNKKFGVYREIIPLEGAKRFDRGRLTTFFPRNLSIRFGLNKQNRRPSWPPTFC